MTRRIGKGETWGQGKKPIPRLADTHFENQKKFVPEIESASISARVLTSIHRLSMGFSPAPPLHWLTNRVIFSIYAATKTWIELKSAIHIYLSGQLYGPVLQDNTDNGIERQMCYQ